MTKVDRLGERAKRVAEKTYRGFRQAQGLIAGGVRNRTWTGKVCRALLAFVKPNILAGWNEQLKSTGIEDKKANGLVRQLFLTIRIWASNKDTNEKEEDGLPKDFEVERRCQKKSGNFVLWVDWFPLVLLASP